MVSISVSSRACRMCDVERLRAFASEPCFGRCRHSVAPSSFPRTRAPSLSSTPKNMSEALRYVGSLEGHKGWVTAIATSSENPDLLLTASRGEHEDRCYQAPVPTTDTDRDAQTRRSLSGSSRAANRASRRTATRRSSFTATTTSSRTLSSHRTASLPSLRPGTTLSAFGTSTPA